MGFLANSREKYRLSRLRRRLEDEPKPEARYRPGQGLSLPGKERTQSLWKVEPIYTDIDDDIWESPDEDDDDWRKRLH